MAETFFSIPKPKSSLLSRLSRPLGVAKEKEYLIESLSLMLSSDMPVEQALQALKLSAKSKYFFALVKQIEVDINSGFHFWQAFAKTELFPDYAISLIRIGEESGRLSENLKLLGRQQQKDSILRQRIRSAMTYPAIVLVLTLTIGSGITWFILPRLATVFRDLKLKIPFLTSLLISLGNFLQGKVNRSTKPIGQRLLFSIPGIKQLIMEIELSRFGYILGSLIGAGVPIIDALQLLAEAGTFYNYKNLFWHLKSSIEEGNSFQKSFNSIKGIEKLLPVPIQQIVIAGEQSGKLEQTFLNIGTQFEGKSEGTAQNLTVILEPVLLVIVWLGVSAVAFAVIMPLYNLVGGLGTSNAGLPATPPANSRSIKTTAPANSAGAVKGATVSAHAVVVTGIPFLNARVEPLATAKIVTKVHSGDVFVVMSQHAGWVGIQLPDGTEAWVSSVFVRIEKHETQ